jgi:hypothetical protein
VLKPPGVNWPLSDADPVAALETSRPMQHDPTLVACRDQPRVQESDPALPPGLPGELLSAAIKSPDGRVGTAQGSLGHLYGTDASYVLGLSVQYPYAEYAVRRELGPGGRNTKSWRAFRPDCARIALLEAACADAVHWWKQQQADAPRLYAPLVGICHMASHPPPGP